MVVEWHPLEPPHHPWQHLKVAHTDCDLGFGCQKSHPKTPPYGSDLGFHILEGFQALIFQFPKNIWKLLLPGKPIYSVTIEHGTPKKSPNWISKNIFHPPPFLVSKVILSRVHCQVLLAETSNIWDVKPQFGVNFFSYSPSRLVEIKIRPSTVVRWFWRNPANHVQAHSVGPETSYKRAYLGGGFKYFFIFTPIWGRFPVWLIFFKGDETTNQL